MKDYKIKISKFYTTDNGESIFFYESEGKKYYQRGYYPVLSANKIDMDNSDVIEMWFESVSLEHNEPKEIL